MIRPIFMLVLLLEKLRTAAMLRNCQPTRWALSNLIKSSLSKQAGSTHLPRCYATLTDVKSLPRPGTRINGFTLRQAEHMPELNMTALHLSHDKTGADYLHVARDDSNNVFAVGFKTNPPDATGVPHILEHLALCGSQKYPVRDPFFKMITRSLASYMNAHTASDYTLYPFATTNSQDFKNLRSVYLDATFNPLLREEDFRQEGWRIAPKDLQRQSSEESNGQEEHVDFKGVVYNEMKGMFSDAGVLFHTRFHQSLIPALNYSGGDPQFIPDLTHQQLKDFHAANYHPSNAKIFTYGDVPLEDHLAEMGPMLDQYKKAAVPNDIKAPIDLSSGPQYVTVPGPIVPPLSAEKQYRTSVTWVGCSNTDLVERFSLAMINTLLTDGYTSPIYQALIDSGLAAEYSPNGGFNQVGNSTVFTIGAAGVEGKNVSHIKKVIFDTIRSAHSQGLDKGKVDGMLHQFELALKRRGAMYGMEMLNRVETDWFNGVDPINILRVSQTLDEFKRRYARPRYLENLLEKYLLNDNTLTFTMEPSESYSQQIVEKEKTKLATEFHEVAKKFPSDDEALQYLGKKEAELEKIQESGRSENVSALPSLRVSEIARTKSSKPMRHSSRGNVKLQWLEAPTNGITYFRAINVLDSIPDELRELLPLFVDCVGRLETKTLSRAMAEDLIRAKTGGISVSYHTSPSPNDPSKFEQGIAISAHALDRNVSDMYDLLRKEVLETDFDEPEAEDKIQQLIRASVSSATDAISEAGTAYAMRYATSGLTSEGAVVEQTSGLTSFKLMADLAKKTEPGSLRDVIEKLKLIQTFILSKSENLRVFVTSEPDTSRANETLLDEFLAQLPDKPSVLNLDSKLSNGTITKSLKTFFPLPFQVYYTGIALPGAPYVNPAGASLSILMSVIAHKHLHHEIREKGGAYGASAFSRGLAGTIGMGSYRDPNPRNTLQVVKSAGLWALERNWTAQDIEEAKLSVFQGIDSPISVQEEGILEFVAGISPDLEKVRRQQLLDVTIDDIKRAADEYLVKGMKNARIAVLGPRNPLPLELGWQEVRMTN